MKFGPVNLQFLAIAVLLLATPCVLGAGTAVEAVHMAFGGSPQQMMISWWTQSITAESVVLYGLTPNNYTLQATGTQGTYNASVGFYHDVILNNLKPQTKYNFGDE